jgi:hypothetical protein
VSGKATRHPGYHPPSPLPPENPRRFTAITAGLFALERLSRCFERPPNYTQLTLVDLEIEDPPRLGIRASQETVLRAGAVLNPGYPQQDLLPAIESIGLNCEY